MVEQYVSHPEIYPSQIIDGQPESFEDSLVHIDFRPRLSRQEIMNRIGQTVTSWWLTEAGRGAIAHEPISVIEHSDSSVDVRFKQFKTGFTGDELGIIHLDGWSGVETINVLDIEWNASSYTLEYHYVHPRNFRCILPQHEARKHSNRAHDSMSTISQELWN